MSSDAKDSSICVECRKVNLISLSKDAPGKRHEIYFNFNQEIEAIQCALCRLILLAIAPETRPAVSNQHLELFISPSAAGQVEIVCSGTSKVLGKLRLGTTNHEGKETGNEPQTNRPRKRLSSWLPALSGSGSLDGKVQYESSVDLGIFSTFRNAMDDCQTHHTQFCSSFRPEYESHENLKLFFIDVKRMCLTKEWATRRYAALSYVWGKAKMLQTTKANIKMLRKESSLKYRLEEIPRVIKDAIEFTRNLGIRYLWVDSLCIIQDDFRKKDAQIAKMNIIYTHAFVTLVSLQGNDANAALRGANGSPLGIDEVIYGLRVAAVPPALSLMLKSSYYNRRVRQFFTIFAHLLATLHSKFSY
jgi:hypothetical protein